MSQPLVVEGALGADEHAECCIKTITLELDILGEPVSLQIKVAARSARLSDIAPLARAVSTKLATVTRDRFRAGGRGIPCHEGCSACCSYLVPLSVPGAFRIAEELLSMPQAISGALIQPSLEACRTILDCMAGSDGGGAVRSDPACDITGLGAKISAVGSACFIYINGTLALVNYLRGPWQIFGFGNFEQRSATAASYPPVGRAAVELPAAAAFRAFGNNLHRCST